MTREDISKNIQSNHKLDESSKNWAERLIDNLNSCDGCIHHKSQNGNFPLSCCECSRFYADGFEVEK
jgi:hypothetical protein